MVASATRTTGDSLAVTINERKTDESARERKPTVGDQEGGSTTVVQGILEGVSERSIL